VHVWERDAIEVALRTVSLTVHGREFRFKIRACERCSKLTLDG
jgi:hypothetical protein